MNPPGCFDAMPDHTSLTLHKPLAGVAEQSGTGGNQKDATMTNQQALEQIARKHLGIDTLASRNSDRLDFHDHAVWSIEAALKAAFNAGQQAAGQGKKGGAK